MMYRKFYILNSMPLEFPEKDIFLRLGGHLSHGSFPETGIFRNIAMQAFELCQPRGRWLIINAVAEKDGIRLDDGTLLPGKDFAAGCRNICAVWCGAVTVGRKVVDFRDGCKSVAESAVCDAVGSECADAAMDFLQKHAAKELLRHGRQLAKRRYSPGYGDMPLTLQKFFFEKLDLCDIGMELTGNYFLIPEKSVTALAGII